MLETMATVAGFPLDDTASALTDSGRAVLAEAVHTAEGLAPGISPHTVLVRSDKHSAFAEHTRDADSLVVGTRRRTPLRRHLGSTTNTAITASNSPVVSVPPAWDSAKESPGPVVVAISRGEEIARLVAIALREAEALHAPLHILYAWQSADLQLAEVGGELPRPPAVSWREDNERIIAEASAGLRADHPDVPVTFDMSQEHPSRAVEDAASGARLLVVGRHHTLLKGLPVIGAVSQAALRAEHAAVMVVPPAAAHPPADRVAAAERVRRQTSRPGGVPPHVPRARSRNEPGPGERE